MSSTDNELEEDPSFVALPARLKRRIESAFDSVASPSTNNVLAGAGSFITEEPESGPSEYEAGGFIIEDLPRPSNSIGFRTHIPLSEIPRALNLLNLTPDDDIMGVFENAAAGWGAQDLRSEGISRKDWRAVCAALLEGEQVDGSGEETPAVDEDFEMETGSDSEHEIEKPSYDTEEPSSDEYEAEQTTTKAKKTRKALQNTLTPTRKMGREFSRQLTESQKAQCRRDFGRFFPLVPDDELDQQRIMIKDITRIADLLKENLKMGEIAEMLEAFSTSPDKSMNLADFERMMILAKLI